MMLTLDSTHLEKPEGEPARLRRVPRVRVTQIVMDHLAHGWSVEEMCRQHPDLRPAEAHAAMVYYYDHRDEIEGEIRAEWAQAESERASVPTTALLSRLRTPGTV